MLGAFIIFHFLEFSPAESAFSKACEASAEKRNFCARRSGSSAHFRKSKTQVGPFGKKMSVRQKTARDASGQNPTLGFHLG
jgi:hypothetical protein